jgi:hypothetical protein
MFALSSNLVFASGGSIAMVNTYPENGGSYLVVDHFIYQVTAVNTNTTVSVSVDNGPLVAMVFQGIINETVNGDNVTQGWYTWQVTMPAMTNPGNHTSQFFSHYYVWQDQYWDEFNAHSLSQSFTLDGPSSTPATSTPTPKPNVPQLQLVPELETWIVLPLLTIVILLSTVILRKRIQRK